MLEASHNHTAQGLALLGLLIKGLRTTDHAIKRLLILQAIDVFCAMGVDILQTPCKLIVQSINEAHECFLGCEQPHPQ